jgi:hypothetical protein
VSAVAFTSRCSVAVSNNGDSFVFVPTSLSAGYQLTIPYGCNGRSCSVGRLNFCWPSPAQSFLSSVSSRSMIKIFVVPGRVSIYSLVTGRIQNVASNSSYIFAGRCLAIARLLIEPSCHNIINLLLQSTVFFRIPWMLCNALISLPYIWSF